MLYRDQSLLQEETSAFLLSHIYMHFNPKCVLCKDALLLLCYSFTPSSVVFVPFGYHQIFKWCLQDKGELHMKSISCVALFAVAMFQNMMLDLPSALMLWHHRCTSWINFLTLERGPEQLFAFINMSAHGMVSVLLHSQIFTPFQETFQDA